ncbi:uncharacterized protein [Panulirus ornatus]|uniref:uncharacterized protein isoform X2 n=1 Tax=Panulirus ornatus TaxID=150431 RepID=UPI003A8BEF38
MGTGKLMKFWSSIINDDNVQDNLKSVMSIEDGEERALQLISRTLFLLVMEIKHERDEVAKNLKRIKENGSICSSCGEKVLDDAVDLWTSEGAYLNYAKPQDQRKTYGVRSLKSPANEEITSKQINQVCGEEGISRSHDDLRVKATKSERSHNKADKTYRCLSRSPKKVSPNISKEDEGEVKTKTENKVKKIVPDILVPETVSLDEHELYVNLLQRKTLATQTVSVPDTLAVDDTKITDKSKYECSYFFDSSLINEGGTCEEKVNALDSHFKREMRSPSKDKAKMSEPKNHGSPVLGKQNRMAPVGATKQGIKGDLHKLLELKDISKESVEIKTPESRGTKAVEFVTSTPRYSPLLFTHNLATSLNTSVDNVSPSLLPAVKSKSTKSANEENWIPSPVKSIDFVHNREQSSSKTKKGSQRSMSHCNMSPPTTKSRGLRKYQSVDRKNKGSLFKMSVDPADPKAKKRYKQTKITATTFLEKTNMARNKDEAAAIDAALEESIKTKAIDDMMREKRKALRASKAFSRVALDGATTTDNKCDQNAGGLVINTSRSPSSEITKPLVSQGVCVASKTAVCSPNKEKMKKMEDSPIKIPKLSPGNCKMSPSKRKLQKQSPCSPVKKKKLKREGEMKTEDEKEVLNLEQLLDQVSQSQKDAEQIVSKKNTSAQGKMVQKKKKKEVFVDSFDIIPVVKTEPNYAHCGEVVRKKAARKQLEGWQCHECEQWYKGQNLTSEEIKMMMNKCSRHRSKHNPVTNTPKDFWNPDWTDDD